MFGSSMDRQLIPMLTRVMAAGIREEARDQRFHGEGIPWTSLTFNGPNGHAT